MEQKLSLKSEDGFSYQNCFNATIRAIEVVGTVIKVRIKLFKVVFFTEHLIVLIPVLTRAMLII